MSLDDKKFKELLNELELTNNEKSWLRDSVQRHGSYQKAEPEIKSFLNHKVNHLEEVLKKIEGKKREIRNEIDVLQKDYLGQEKKRAKESYKLKIDQYKKIKSDQKQNVDKVILRSEQFKRKLDTYRLKIKSDSEQKSLADIRKKLV